MRALVPLLFVFPFGAALAANPLISSFSPSTGPTQGSVPITIVGTSFGTAEAASVSVGEGTCPLISQADTQIVCALPPGTGLEQRVMVTVAGTTALAPSRFSYQAPAISSITPQTGPTSGIPLTVVGANLGPSGSAALTVGDRVCPVTSGGHTQVICMIAEGTGTSLAVRLVTGGQAATASSSFSYAAPQLTGLAPSSGPTPGGVTLVLTGSNLGPPGRASVSLGGSRCETIDSGHTFVACRSPAGAGLDHPLTVVVDGRSASLPAAFDYLPPQLADLTPASGPTNGGTLLTIVGSNFGPTGSARVSLGEADCPLQTHEHGRLICTLPAGTGPGHAVQVSVAGQTHSPSLAFSYDPVLLGGVSPARGPTSGGTLLTVTGANFGPSGNTQVTVGGAPCPIQGQTHSQLTCVAPAGVGVDHPVVGLSAGRTSTLTSAFSYAAPAVNSVTPSRGPLAGGVALTIRGESFGSGGAAASVGGAPCSVIGQTQTSVECLAPAGTAYGDAPVSVTVGGQSSPPTSGLFEYRSSAPTLEDLAVQTDEDTSATIALQGQDPDGDALTYLLVAGPPTGQGSVTIEANSAHYTPPPDFSGSTSFQVAPFDGTMTGAFATVSVAVQPTPDAPVATPASADTGEDTPVTLTLGGVDADGDPLTFRIEGAPSAIQGTVTLAGDQATFTPAKDFVGIARFTFTASDGVLSSSPAPITLSVAGRSDSPSAVAQEISTPEDSVALIALSGFDPDGESLSFSLVAQPPAGEGTVTLEGARARYVPPANFSGTTGFTYQVSDGTLVSEPATVSLQVTAVNDPPVAFGGVATVTSGGAVTIALTASDVDGDALQFAVVENPEAETGTVTISGAGATFEASSGFTGNASFTWSVSDGVASTTATTLVQVDQAPASNCAAIPAGPGGWLALLTLAGLLLRRRAQ
ncbi:MAG: IPT/TIG domain-containing protein [Myxococcota bacterium]|nr:IPT/TIG domain-containing protein [Myxococcota bacterium]